MKAKLILLDGAVAGVYMDAQALASGLEIDIVDARSARDSDEAVMNEVHEPGMAFIGRSPRSMTRRPKKHERGVKA